MSIWTDIGYIAMGGYYAAEKYRTEKQILREVAEVEGMLRRLCDKELEKEVREKLYALDTAGAEETWDYLELFKRDKPHLLSLHSSTSFWHLVGVERYPLTLEEFEVISKRKNLSKEDEKCFNLSIGRVVTLLMNTYGKYSEAEALRTYDCTKFGFMIEYG